MEINPQVKGILKQCKINVDQGILCLLAIYFKTSPDTIIPEEIIRKINLTKIIDKDYTNNTVIWNIPLFVGQEAGAFDWVVEWIKPFGKIGGPSREGRASDVIKRMKDWFAKNPQYRKEDVFAARDLYFRTDKPTGQYVKTSTKFIIDGDGVKEVSLLTLWCERAAKVSNTNSANPLMKGKLM